jgi:hypothetical protein
MSTDAAARIAAAFHVLSREWANLPTVDQQRILPQVGLRWNTHPLTVALRWEHAAKMLEVPLNGR